MLLVLLLVAVVAGWAYDRRTLQANWNDTFEKQMADVAHLVDQYVSYFKAHQAWPPQESLETGLEYNGSTMAGTVRIDRYACGVLDEYRFDLILKPDGRIDFQCRNRQ